MRPDLLGLDPLSLERIRGQLDVPSLPIGPYPADNYLDPVAGHGTFIAGIIEQLTPGCTIACAVSSSRRGTSPCRRWRTTCGF